MSRRAPRPPDVRDTVQDVGVLTASRLSTALALLTAAADSLTEAHWSATVAERYDRTRLAVLRSAAAVLAVRGGARRGAGPTPVWDLLPRVAPELTEWSEHFAAATAHDPRAGGVLPAGGSVRLVDDLLRDGEEFARVVSRLLGLPQVEVTSDRATVTAVPGRLQSAGPAGQP